MKNILTSFDRLMAAVTFAEANEPELALKLVEGRKPAQSPPNRAATMSGGKVLTNQAAH